MRRPQTVRVAAVQYELRAISSFEEFAHQVEYFVDAVADYKADFAVFPELFTLQLLSIENRKVPAAEAIAALTTYTGRFKEMMSELAVSYNVNIIGGSHPTREPDGEVYNISYVFLRDGSVYEQYKVHPTPNERYWWNIRGGERVTAIETDCGPIGVAICYDCEFPELVRHLTDQGAAILFVPFCTDERQSYMRVRYCAQARAVENQCFVVMAGNVGNLPKVENMDIQYSQSCVLTPCDFPFARDGIAAETAPNVEMITIADLQLDSLYASRQGGTVQNLKDRRFDLYSLIWRGHLSSGPAVRAGSSLSALRPDSDRLRGVRNDRRGRRLLPRRLREGELGVVRRHHAEDVERHRDQRVIAADADQLDGGLVADQRIQPLVGAVADPPRLVELLHEGIDRALVLGRRLRLAPGFQVGDGLVLDAGLLGHGLVSEPLVLRAPQPRRAQDGEFRQPRRQLGVVAAMGAERLRQQAEFGRVHPGGKGPAHIERFAARTGAQRRQQRALGVAQVGFGKDGKAWRGALGGHGTCPGMGVASVAAGLRLV